MPPLHPEDIKAAVRKRGGTLADLARRLRPPVTSQAITNVLSGHSRSKRIEAALAEASGYSLADVQTATRPIHVGDGSDTAHRADAPTGASDRTGIGHGRG